MISELITHTTLAWWIIAGIFALSFLFQMGYYLLRFTAILRHKSSQKSKSKRGISVIICAKNEADNLEKHLPLFLEQDYPDFEVVVVNDCSSDHTEDLLSEFKVRYPRLHYTTIHENRKFQHGKKLAVTVGIKAAKNEHLLFSDADCYPASDQWLKKMSNAFSKKTSIILGVGKYERKRGLLNLIVRWETFFTAMQYLSLAIKGRPYMGVGRNLAYTKKLFYDNKGFASHLKLLSGDDDLFINEVSTAGNTRVEISPESFTYSKPPTKFRHWCRQKKRHLTTGKYYQKKSKRDLASELISRILFYGTGIALLLQEHWFYPALLLWIVLVITKLVIVKLNMVRLKEKDLLLPSLLLDLVIPFLLFFIHLSNVVRPQEPKWN